MTKSTGQNLRNCMEVSKAFSKVPKEGNYI